MNLSIYRRHQDFFNHKAGDWSISEQQIQFIAGMDKLIGFNGAETILDIGCGTGHLLKYLQTFVPRGLVIGIDFAEQMLVRCQAQVREPLHVIQSLAEQLPIRSASVDIVMNYCLYPHLQYKQIALQEFHRILKPGGRYYIIHPEGRQAVNALHNRIGVPVCFDLIEPLESVTVMLEINGFQVRKALDEADRFFIEAVKFPGNNL
ncbi:MAG: class I SAM-dependent methyltransferase [Fidelibacterota bacterium]